MDFNKEILVVENMSEQDNPLLTDYSDLASQYKVIRNTYLQPLILAIILGIWRFLKINQSTWDIILNVILVLFIIYFGMMIVIAHKNFKYYQKQADIAEN